MIILIGILGLLQCAVLPAMILLRLFRIRGGIIERAVYGIPLSMLWNYLLVWLLTLFRIYTRPVLLCVIAAECLWIIYLYRKTLLSSISENGSKIRTALKKECQPLRNVLEENSLDGWIWMLLGAMSISGILWGCHLVQMRIGEIFSGWDTLFSWNLYAESWAEGRIPKIVGLYPQFIPANWSLSYVLLGTNDIQFFNTVLPPLFFLMILVMIFDLGFQQENAGFFIAAVLCRYMMKKLMGDQLFDGYMDVPAAALTLLPVYTFLRAEGIDLEQRKKRLALGVLFAGCAAVTKQIGLTALGLLPLIILYWMKDAAKALTKKEWGILIGILLLTVLPWYGYCFYLKTTADKGTVATGIVSFNEKFEFSHKLFLARQSLGKYLPFFILSLIGLPLVKKKYRLPLFLFTWPIVIVWIRFFSYDARNVGSALPFISITCGLAVWNLWQLLERTAIRRLPLIVPAVLLLLAAIFLLPKLLPDVKIREDQRVKQRALFGERLNNELLYGVFGDTHEGQDILTDYPAYFLSGYKDCCTMTDFTDPAGFKRKIEKGKMHYLLKPEPFEPGCEETAALFDEYLAGGKLKEIRCSDGYFKPHCLYEIGE